MKKLLEYAKEPGFDKVVFLIALLGCFLFLVLIAGLYFFFKVPLTPLEFVIAAVLFCFKDLVNFKWGSSDGSKDKDETLKGIVNKATTKTDGQ